MITFSIIKKSQLEGAKRIDAEYYQKEYYIDFSKGNWQSIGKILETCQYGISQSMNEELIGYPIFKMNDIDDAFLVDQDLKYVDLIPSLFPQYKLETNDVLFNRVNAENFVGRTGIFKLKKDCVFASYLIRLRLKKDSGIFPDYLNIFLNSIFGKKQIKRYMRRAVNQANVNAEELKQMKILILSEEFQKNIEIISNKIWGNYELSKTLYSQAEDLLLEELGIKDFKFKNDLFFVVNLSKTEDRIDADYFQPKYEQLTAKLKLFKANKLENYISNYSTGFTFKSDNYQEKGIPLIRINNIKKGLIDLSDTAYLSEKDFSLSPKDEAKAGDIVLSMSGSIGLTAMIPPEIPKCSVNQRILKFTSKNINREYLVLVLNSIVGELQLERIGTGGVQTNISYSDIKNIIIPELNDNIQQKIAELVKKSHEARRKSKELLDEAKRKVEEMIEKR